ncbi:MAG: dihydrofolate reductase family protein [Chitinophagaceae bacterium]|nr:dihydrofolate reductase family protein [Chitinophagaceae bacterium]
MKKIILIAHISLDGFVANQNGELDDFEPGDENLAFVTEISKEADTILFGRVTYTMLNTFWPGAGKQPGASKAVGDYSDWYNSANKIVASKTIEEVDDKKTIVLRKDIIQHIKQLKLADGKAIIVFGNPDITQQLMQHNLIDEYWIFVNPVLFGKGIPLFKETDQKQKLNIADSRQFPNGELAIKYVPVK